MFFDKSATKKVLFLNLICNGIQNDFDRDFWVLVCCILINAKFNLIQTRTALLLCNFFPLIRRLFLKKFIIKGYSIEKLLRKSMKPKSIHQKI
jgi:hypothetical protein